MKALIATLADMREASAAVDDANGTSDYNVRLVALALIARHFLREHADELDALLQGAGRLHTPSREDRHVACETDEGLLNVHAESETCEVCAPREREIRRGNHERPSGRDR